MYQCTNISASMVWRNLSMWSLLEIAAEKLDPHAILPTDCRVSTCRITDYIKLTWKLLKQARSCPPHKWSHFGGDMAVACAVLQCKNWRMSPKINLTFSIISMRNIVARPCCINFIHIPCASLFKAHKKMALREGLVDAKLCWWKLFLFSLIVVVYMAKLYSLWDWERCMNTSAM